MIECRAMWFGARPRTGFVWANDHLRPGGVKGSRGSHISRDAIGGSRRRVESPGDVIIHLWEPEAPQALEFPDWVRLVPVDAQIGDGPCHVADQKHADRVNRPLLAA